jgi:hypothetical protein
MRFPLVWLALFLIHSALRAQSPALEYRGRFIEECTLPGETRRDDVVPRHANAIQLSADRWLVIYSTHGYRGVDDERSIVYQVRAAGPDGRLLKEGFLARTSDDWQPAGVPAAPAGHAYVKQHGHMVAFGVPRGALLAGQLAASANCFAAMWRVLGRPLNVAEKRLDKTAEDSALFHGTIGIEWCQFRLNEAGDDLELTQPVRPFRQQGFENGETFCEHSDAGWINQSFCPPVAANDAKTEWAVADHFANRRVAAVQLRFNPASKLYEWVKTGPFIGDAKTPVWEASLLRTDREWILAARSNGKVAWARSKDPFQGWSEPAQSDEPSVNAPLTAFQCADGLVRLFTGDRAASPQQYDRDPLYCWEVQTQPRFVASNRRVVFDSREAKLPIRPEVRSKVDFCELFPLHGQRQLVVFGVSTRGYNFPYEKTSGIPAIMQAEKDAAGIYYATLTYAQALPEVWHFSK